MFKKLYGLTAYTSGKGIKKWLLRRFPIYFFFAFITVLYGVKGFMTAFLLLLSFFLGWTFKGLFQAIKDWRLTQTLNRVYFSQVEYDSLHRENKMLHEVVQAYKDSATATVRGGGGAAAYGPQAASTLRPRPRYDSQEISDILNQMQQGQQGG